MKLRYLGYPCTNVTLNLTTGRTLRLANLKEPRLSEVVRENLSTLLVALRWNVERDIYFFRIASSVDSTGFARGVSRQIGRSAFANELAEIRAFVEANNLRLSMHPGQYTILERPAARGRSGGGARVGVSRRLFSRDRPPKRYHDAARRRGVWGQGGGAGAFCRELSSALAGGAEVG